MEIFITKEKEHSLDKWGDYGHILIHGMTRHIGRKNGFLQLERTGPFVPPISFPGSDMLVTEEIKYKLENKLSNLEFKEVHKARIVDIPWHLWDHSLDEPPIYPKSGEPEDYILEREHSPSLSEEIGALWEVQPDINPKIQKVGGAFNSSSYSGEPLIRASDLGGYLFASIQFKSIVESIASEWVSFSPAVMI